MKLPRYQRQGIRQLPKMNVGAPLQVANAAANANTAISRAFGQAGELFTDVAEHETNLQVEQASLAIEQDEQEFQRRYAGKMFFTPDEIDGEIDVQRTEKNYNPETGEYEDIERAIPRDEVFSAMYATHMKKSLDTHKEKIVLAGARENWYREAGANISQLTTEQYVKGMNNRAKERRALVKTDFTQAVQNESWSVAAKLIDAFEGTPQEKEEMIMLLNQEREVSVYHNLLATDARTEDDLVNIEDAIDQLRDPDAMSYLPMDKRIALANNLERTADQNYLSMNNQKLRQEGQIISDTEMSIRKGDNTITEADIQGLYDNGSIKSYPEMTRLKKLLIDQQTARTKGLMDDAQLDLYVAKGLGIDPKNSNLRKAADKRFESSAAETMGENYTGTTRDVLTGGDVYKELSSEHMRKFRVIPKQVEGYMRAANRADSPYLLDATVFYKQAEAFAPTALKDLTEGEVGLIQDVSAYMDLGMAGEEAVATVREWEMMQPHQKEAIRDQRKVLNESNTVMLNDFIDDDPQFDVGFFESQPDVSGTMNAHYEGLVELALPRVGYNIAAAQQRAYSQFKKDYQITDVNGDKEFMKNAPVGMSTEVLQTDLQNRFNPEGMEDIQLRVSSDSITELEKMNGRPMSYRVLKMREDGEPLVMPERWIYQPERIQQEHNEALMEQARVEREKVQMARIESAERKERWRERLGGLGAPETGEMQ